VVVPPVEGNRKEEGLQPRVQGLTGALATTTNKTNKSLKGATNMKTFNVVFHYSLEVVAEDEDTAQDMAWQEFANANPNSGDEFACTVEEKES
jgi:hypothetical protein